MPEEIVIRPAAMGEAQALLDVMRRAFAEYRGVLQPESSVFVETAAAIAGKLAAAGGFLALENARRSAASSPSKKARAVTWDGWRSIRACAGVGWRDS